MSKNGGCWDVVGGAQALGFECCKQGKLPEWLESLYGGDGRVANCPGVVSTFLG